MTVRPKEALDYHSQGRKGKIEVVTTKPVNTARQLSLAYTPGVAEPCLRIKANPDDVYEYTAKGNLVAVVTNGTAVLGLGDIGPAAGKPVMEGKGVLFKKFADIDVFDIEVDAKDPDEFIRVVKALEPTFGGINLEDIKAPECFYIEKELRRLMNIPVFHDDQHGTAIISGAAFLNACELQGKDPATVKIVVSGAGAAAIACMELYCELGARHENVWLVDSKGVVYEGRSEGMNEYKARFAQKTDRRTLAEAMEGADVFVGVSVGGLVTGEMVAHMAARPIVFAMANPDPEIGYQEARAVRPDLIMATGRSDYPNQVNNVLGFPFIFRGALDARAREINTEMQIAAARALAALAREDVPDSVAAAYGGTRFRFGPEYIIPKPFDSRVLLRVAPAVAEAAVRSGVARLPIDTVAYHAHLEKHLGRRHEVMRVILTKAKADPRRIVFPEGTEEKILRAAQNCVEEGIARPILLGSPEAVRARAAEVGVDLHGMEIVHPRGSDKNEAYAQRLWDRRRRKGVTMEQARREMHERTSFGMMMVEMGDADGCVDGLVKHYPETIRPALQILGKRQGIHYACGMYVIVLKNDIKFFADPTVNIHPSAECLAEIAISTAEACRWFDIEPRVAMLSYSNFGSTPNEDTARVAEAVRLVRARRPELMVDGEMQVDTALDPETRNEFFGWSDLKENANVLIFPDLASGNVAYKLMGKLGGAETIGPILLGMRKPVNVLQRGCDVNTIVNMAALTVVRAQGGLEAKL
jgi:malate dehydrogenase (oxaloacetate-decarboxylating)(NADP+)